MRHCYVVDVFTHEGRGGNPLGVIPDSVEFSDKDMQDIATELGYSESVFIEWNQGAPHLRIFTPAKELPFAGHPLVGTAWVLMAMGPGCEKVTIALGEVPISMDGDLVWVLPPEVDRPVQRHDAPDAVGRHYGIAGVIEATDVEVPMRFRYLELTTDEEVVAAVPDFTQVEADVDGLYLYSRAGDVVRSRFFAPALGVPEDPATGSAAVGLTAIFHSLGETSGAATVLQGQDQLSEIRVTWNGNRTRLGGLVTKRDTLELDR